MNRLKLALILFIILFILTFLIDYLFIKRPYLYRLLGKKKTKKKNNELMEISYLKGKFKLDKHRLPMKNLLIGISFLNALIISLVAVVVILIKLPIILQLIIGFALLLSLIYSIYELLGRSLVKKGYDK